MPRHPNTRRAFPPCTPLVLALALFAAPHGAVAQGQAVQAAAAMASTETSIGAGLDLTISSLQARVKKLEAGSTEAGRMRSGWLAGALVLLSAVLSVQLSAALPARRPRTSGAAWSAVSAPLTRQPSSSTSSASMRASPTWPSLKTPPVPSMTLGPPSDRSAFSAPSAWR